MSFTVSVAAQSDPGCVRKSNQDRFGYDLSRQLYAVCDGMGGMSGGEVASELAIQSLLSPVDVDSEPPGVSQDVLLFHLVLAANRVVRQASLENPSLHGMGTTLVAACVDAERLLIANVGDSRAYLIRDGGCAQLTKDHSFLEEQISLGMMTREMAVNSPVASVITRAVGVDEVVEPDLFSLALADNDLVLLTSDGLTRYLGAEELAAVIHPSRSLEETCSGLIDTAKSLGAVDNVTCLLLLFRQEAEVGIRAQANTVLAHP